MKRSIKLRRRSKTNSRPHENLELRHTYMQTHPVCGLCSLVPQSLFESPTGIKIHGSCDPHHIFHDTARYDVRSNLLAVCRPAHNWLHEQANAGKVVAVWCKAAWSKLELEEEFDPMELQEVMAPKCPIGLINGWYEQHELPDWCDQYARDVLEQFTALIFERE